MILTSVFEKTNDSNVDVKQALMKINFKDVIFMIIDIWNVIAGTGV